MCGILAIFGLAEDARRFRPTFMKLAKRIRHRGPDWSGCYAQGDVIIGHERLSIIDVCAGSQPLYADNGQVVLAVNGEVYNYKELTVDLAKHFTFKTQSDAEVILHSFRRDRGPGFLNELRGMYGFVVYNANTGRYIAARDHMGIIPLYIGWSKDGAVWFASELKALSDHCTKYIHFPPGHYYDSAHVGDGDEKFHKWYNPQWHSPSYFPTEKFNPSHLREAVIATMRRHMVTDVTFGVLLNGDIASSIVGSICNRLLQEQLGSYSQLPEFMRLRSFAVGLEGSPELEVARKVADFLGTNHHEFHFTVQDGLDSLADCIYHIETFDVETVRTSTPFFLMSRLVKATGTKMVLCGDGADEIFGASPEFRDIKDGKELQKTASQLLQDVHMYGCCRVNKGASAWGVEPRTPFMDVDFLDAAMGIDPKEKLPIDPNGNPRIDHYLLRKAFDTPDNPYLPEEVLWRPRDENVDHGYSWIDSLHEFADMRVTDVMFEFSDTKFPDAPPETKEEYLYHQIFENHFPAETASKSVGRKPSSAVGLVNEMAAAKAGSRVNISNSVETRTFGREE